MDIEEARRQLAQHPPQGDPTAVAGETLDEKAGRLHVAQGPGDDTVSLPRADLDRLLAVATFYLESFDPEEALSMTGLLMLQDIEDTVARHGKRY